MHTISDNIYVSVLNTYIVMLNMVYMRMPSRPGRGRQHICLVVLVISHKFPREESFTILLRERNPLLFYSERGILYYSTPREESFTILTTGMKQIVLSEYVPENICG